MEWLISNLDSLFIILFAIHALAKSIVILTPTPTDDEWVARFYKLIERIALVVGHSKEKNPTLEKDV